MPEPQIKFNIMALDRSRQAFDSFAGNVRRSRAEVVAMQNGSRRGWDDFIVGAGRAKTELAGFATQVRGLLALLGVSIGASAIKDALDDMGRLSDQAKQTGIDVETLQELIFAGSQSGVEESVMVSALTKLNLQIGEALSKGNDLGKILEANNVQLRDSAGNIRPTVDVFLQLVDLIRNAGSEQEKAVIANAAFARGYRDLLPLIEEGSLGIRKLGDEARNSGQIVDSELVSRGDELGDEFERAIGTIDAAWKRMVVGAINGLDEILGGINTVFQKAIQFDTWLRSNTGRGLFMTPLAEILNIGSDQVNRDTKTDPLATPGRPLEVTVTRPTIVPNLGSRGGGGGGRRSTGGGGSSFNLQDDVLRGLDEQIRLLEAQRRAFGLSEGAAKGLEERERALNEIRAQGREPTAEEIRLIEERTEKIGALTDALDEARDQMEFFGEIGDSVASSLDEAFSTVFEGGKFKVKDFVQSALADLAKLTFKQYVSGPIGDFITKGLGSFFGGGAATVSSGPTSIIPQGLFGGSSMQSAMAGAGAANSNVRINVNNNMAGSAAVGTRERVGADGAREIDFYIEEKAQRAAGKAVKQAAPVYGMQRPLTRRS